MYLYISWGFQGIKQVRVKSPPEFEILVLEK